MRPVDYFYEGENMLVSSFHTHPNRELFPRNKESLLTSREFHLPKPKSSPDEVFGIHTPRDLIEINVPRLIAAAL